MMLTGQVMDGWQMFFWITSIAVLGVILTIPMKTQITPVIIMGELDMFDYGKATAIAVVMLVVSFVLLLSINVLQWWTNRYNTNNLA